MGWIDYHFEAIGTQWHISFAYPERQDWSALRDKVQAKIAAFDACYSRFRDDSLIAQIAKNPGEYALPSDARNLFNLYYQLYILTNGNFTPLIGQSLVQAGYDAQYSLSAQELTRVPLWDEALDYRFPQLRVKRPVLLDFGAAGKGYLVDLISQLLIDEGIRAFCVDGSGDMFYRQPSNEKLRVGLEHPLNTNEVIGVAEILNQSICGSAGNRRAWGQYHHIIDPRTLQSPVAILAVWVVANQTIIADALATCLFFDVPEKLAEQYDFEYLIMYQDTSIKRSAAFPAEIFVQ